MYNFIRSCDTVLEYTRRCVKNAKSFSFRHVRRYVGDITIESRMCESLSGEKVGEREDRTMQFRISQSVDPSTDKVSRRAIITATRECGRAFASPIEFYAPPGRMRVIGIPLEMTYLPVAIAMLMVPLTFAAAHLKRDTAAESRLRERRNRAGAVKVNSTINILYVLAL